MATEENMKSGFSWSWVILVASCVEGMLLIGSFRVFGLYFVEFQQTLNCSTASISLVLSMHTVVFSAVSLLILSVSDILDASRQIVIIGGFLTFLGFFLSSFATNTGTLILTISILYGSGGAMVHGPTIVALSQHFQKRQGMANTINSLGSSIGALVLAPTVRFLLDVYGVQGTLWIHSAMLLNTVVVGAVLRSPPLDEDEDLVGNNLEQTDKLLSNGENREEKTFEVQVKQPETEANAKTNGVKFDRSISLIEKSSPIVKSISGSKLRYVSESCVLEQREENNIESAKPRVNKALSNSITIFSSVQVCEFGSVASLNTGHREPRTLNERQPTFLERLRSLTLKELVGRLFDLRLFKNVLFLLNTLTSLLVVQGLALLATYIPPHAEDIGLSVSQSAVLLTVYAGFDLLNKIVVALISDFRSIKRHNLVGGSLIITGISIVFVPFYTTFIHMLIFLSIFGLFYGTFFALFPVLLVDFIGLHNLSKGLAFTMILHGISISAMNPLYGFLRDDLGSLNVPFIMMGCGVLLGGILLCAEPLFRKLEEKRQQAMIDKQTTAL